MMQKFLNFIKREIKPYRSLFSLFMYTIFSLIYTFPLVLHINKLIVGDLEGDMWKHLWGFWWVRERIIEDKFLPLFTSILNYPYGGNLFFIDPMGALLSIPLQAILPIHVVYNLLVLINLILGAFCAYLLADYFTKNRTAAFYSGAVYAFTSYMLAYITSGVSETFNIAWMPLFLYFFARFLDENSESLAILAGLTLFLSVLGSFYYGSFTTILGMFYFFYFAYQQYKKIVITGKDNEVGDPNILNKLNIFHEKAEPKSSITSSSDLYRQALRAESSHKKADSFHVKGKAYGGKKVLGFREWILSIVGYISIILMVITIPLIVFFLPSYMATPNKSQLGFVGVTVSLIFIFLTSLIYALWFYRAEIKNFVYSLQAHFYSNNPSHVKRKMFLIFGFYTISVLGIFYLQSIIHLYTFPAIFRAASLTFASVFIALTLTFMLFRGREQYLGKTLKAKTGESETRNLQEARATFLEYARVIIPWLILIFSILNILRIIVFYQEIDQAFGFGNIMGNLAVSILLLIAVLIHIISSRLYLKWKLFVQLYIDPELRESEKTESRIKWIIRRNIAITVIFILAVSLPPLILFYQGISSDVFIKSWFTFTFVVASIGAVLFMLSRITGEKLDTKDQTGLSAYVRIMLRGPIMKLIIMSIVALAFIGPLFYSFKSSLSGSQGLVKRERSLEFIDLYLSQRFHNISRLVDYVAPGKDRIQRTYTVDRLTRSSYMGWLTLILAVTALFISRKRKNIWFWLFCAIFFTAFSLGPYLYVKENVHLNFRFPIYILFYKYFPFFNQISIPYRFNLCAMLSWGILAGYALSTLLEKLQKHQQKIAVTILSLAMLFEICIASPAPYPLPLSDLTVPTFYTKLAADPQEYGIIDSPIQRVKGELLPGEYFYYQMIHRKGIPYKVEGTIPVYIYENQFTVYLFNLEKGYSVSPPKEELLKQYLDELKKNKFKYIVVHNEYLRKSARQRVHTYLEYFLGKPEKMERDLYIYKIY